ncbi:hypothetical protein CMI37_19385 [Candidatus Pacearchaeota archaeon]|nr:hypothetical protein [Candidatus Pacearchaeota archaeon]
MKKIVVELILKEVGLSRGEVEELVEVPPQDDLGDYAFPCFALAKKEKKNVMLIAEELAEKIRRDGLPKEISNVDFKGGYVNFFIDKKILAARVLAGVGVVGGAGRRAGGKVMIEFSQANTHKAFHIGHIRGTSIGESLARIFEAVGNKVVRANYQGDTGMHVAKWIWCYNKYHKNEKLKKDESWVAGIYVDAVKRLAKNEKLQQEVNEVNKKLDARQDKELNELWKKTRKLSLDSLEIIYKDLNTKFDKYYFESDMEKGGKQIVKELVKKKVAKVSDGAVIMDLSRFALKNPDSQFTLALGRNVSKSKSPTHLPLANPNKLVKSKSLDYVKGNKGLGVWVLLRSDGTVLYSAKDLALAEKKFKDFKLDRSLYVVANEQDLHMKQLVKTLKLDGVKNAGKIGHVSYGMVRLPTGKMSSRTGDNILYSDFKKEIVSYAESEIAKRFKLSKKELEKRGLAVAVAAIKYSMLKQSSNKNIIFDKTQALKFEGDTGPYLLYSYARASSIVRKVKGGKVMKIVDLKDEEIRLLKKLDGFGSVVESAYDNLAPSLIANYCYELAKDFNEFYHCCPVLGSEEEGFRLQLVEAFRVVMKKGLGLLGVGVLGEM